MSRNTSGNSVTSRRWWLMLLLAVLCAVPFAVKAQEADHSTLKIFVTGFNSSDCYAIAQLFRPGQDVMKIKHAYRRQQQAIKARQAAFVFENVPYGEYAISVFHDKNGNGELDHLGGLPVEQLGFSNGFRLSLFSGLPNFEKLKTAFSAESKTVEIVLK